MRITDFQITELPPGRHVLDVEACCGVAGCPIMWTVLVARGRRTGKTLLVTAGVHGDEYEGMEAIREVFGALDSVEMAGTFVGLPVANVSAYQALTREGVDGQMPCDTTGRIIFLRATPRVTSGTTCGTIMSLAREGGQ